MRCLESLSDVVFVCGGRRGIEILGVVILEVKDVR